MSGSALREHLRLLDELKQIVGAMKNLAYAELQRSGRALQAHAQAEAALLQAMADTGFATSGTGPARLLVIGAERGFCGGFNDHLVDALDAELGRQPQVHCLLAGERLQQRLAERLPSALSLPGCAASEEARQCVDTWLAALSDQPAGPLHVLMHDAAGPMLYELLPRPDFPPPSGGGAPQQYLDTPALHRQLTGEWLRIGLLGCLLRSLQQENRWRLAQMQRAQDHLDARSTALGRQYFRERQADITSELETLMSALG